MQFKNDETILGINRKVASMYKEKFGKGIDSNIVQVIAQSQWYLVPDAFKQKLRIKFDYFGKLKPSEVKVEKLYKEVKNTLLPLPIIKFSSKKKKESDNVSDRNILNPSGLQSVPNPTEISG